MPQHVQAPDGSVVEFPDGMSDAAMTAAMQREYGGPDHRPTSQALGFAEGVAEPIDRLYRAMEKPGVVKSVADATAAAFPPFDLARTVAREGVTKRAIPALREREETTRPGEWGRFFGGLAVAAPSGGIGGPALSGAVTGALTSDADDLAGRAVDTGLGAIGGKAGGVAARKAADVFAPILEPAVERLVKAGVRLTPGQIRGGSAMRAEDKATSLPFLGNRILDGRIRSLEDANRVLTNDVMEPLGQKLDAGVKVGHQAVDAAHRAVSDAYEEVVPKLAVQLDPRFVAGMRRVWTDVSALPDAQQNQFQGILKNIKFGDGGALAGKRLQNALSEVGRLRGVYMTSSVASERELGKSLGGLRDELVGMLFRQNPAEAPALKGADAAFQRLAVLENAASKAGDGVATPGNIRTAVRMGDGSRRKSATARGIAPMQQRSSDISAVLPARIPNSGTADRFNLTRPIAGARGAVGSLTHRIDQAVSTALAKTDPALRAKARKAILLLQRPTGLLGALSALGVADQ